MKSRDKERSLKTVLRIVFLKKFIFPSTLIFLAITIFFTAVKIRLDLPEFRTLIGNRSYVLVFLLTSIFYFTLIFLFSFNKTSSKFFYSQKSLLYSFIKMIIWIGILYFLVRNYPKDILNFLYWILLAGSIIWLTINSWLINHTLMKNVGLEKNVHFSWFKFILGIFLFAISFYGSYWIWLLNSKIPYFIVWIVFTAVFALMMIIFPKFALNTAGFYSIVFLYFTIYIYDYINQTSTSLDGFYSINKFTLNIILLIINYLLLILTVGKIGSSVNVQNEEKRGTGRNLFFVFLITISYLTLEFVFPTVFPDLSNPELLLLLFRFFSLLGTSIFVYLYKVIYKRRKKQ